MTHEERLAAFLQELQREFPGLTIEAKRDVWHQRLAGLLLKIITFGAQSSYMTNYTTTLGAHIYTPSNWESYTAADRYIILRHERAHLRQFQRYGAPLMVLLYGLLPLPAGLSYFRMRFEREGYEESIRAARELFGVEYVRRDEYQQHILRQFTSGAYGWMWPFPGSVMRWVKSCVEENNI